MNSTGSGHRLWQYAPVAFVISGFTLGYVFGVQDYLSLTFLAQQREALRIYVDANLLWSALLFLVIYILAVAFSFPAASVLTIFGGFLFGWLIGGALVAIGATIGASILFLATRSAFGGFLRARVDGFANKLADGFRANAFSYLFVIRLAPVFPSSSSTSPLHCSISALADFSPRRFSEFYPAPLPMPISARVSIAYSRLRKPAAGKRRSRIW